MRTFNEFLFIYQDEKGGMHWCMYMYGNTESALTAESLDAYLPNLVGIKYSLPPHICFDFGPNPPRGRSRAGPLEVKGGPSPKDFVFRVGRLQQQTECKAMINDLRAFGKKCC